MSTRRNSSSVIAQIVIAVVLFIIVFNAIKQNRRQSPVAPGPSVQPVTRTAENPILGQLSRHVQANSRNGIAIGIALDVSGSMQNTVDDQHGKQKAKIAIARQCVMNILKETEAFVQQHPNQVVEVGIFEFSSRQIQPSCREVVNFGPVRLDSAKNAVERMYPKGGTPIGDAVITVKQKMNATGLKQQHLLVITDGENNEGYDPGDVVNAMYRLPDEQRTSVYFFAFDVAADKFNRVRDAGGLILAASNEQGLQQTLDYVLSGKILVEQPEVPGAR